MQKEVSKRNSGQEKVEKSAPSLTGNHALDVFVALMNQDIRNREAKQRRFTDKVKKKKPDNGAENHAEKRRCISGAFSAAENGEKRVMVNPVGEKGNAGEKNNVGGQNGHGCECGRSINAPRQDDVTEHSEQNGHDAVNHPSHYCQGGIECIDAIQSAVNGLDGPAAWLTGSIIKYVWRWSRKNGAEDLRKARFYLDRLIRVVEDREAAKYAEHHIKQEGDV